MLDEVVFSANESNSKVVLSIQARDRYILKSKSFIKFVRHWKAFEYANQVASLNEDLLVTKIIGGELVLDSL